ncbi:hypothetical protein QQ045_012484 [Rhodiola kirilowii]
MNLKNLIILIPYPAQGHLTPMVKLGQAFHTRGFQPVVITPESIHTQLCKNQSGDDSVVYISVPETTRCRKHNDFFGIERAMEDENMPLHLERIMSQLEEDGGSRVVCLVVDLLASWAIPVGIRKGILVAGFWPAMLATYHLLSAIPDMVRSGFISPSDVWYLTGIPVKEGAMCSLPGQPLISTQDLPWMIGDINSTTARFQFWIRTLHRSASLSHLFVNSFTAESLRSDQDHPTLSVLPVGALSTLQPKLETKTFPPSFWEEDTDCLHWLDTQISASVLYISFGSWVSPIAEAKINSLAAALEATAQPFLWVLGSSWRQGLPGGFSERVSNRGRVVLWAPQREVLKHKAVGCYLSHCGWNSITEAIRFQKKLLCYPLAGDQFLNCKYVVDVWKIGIRMFDLEQEELERGMRNVMGNEEMSGRLAELKDKFVGEKATSGAMDNLTFFIRYMHMQKNVKIESYS